MSRVVSNPLAERTERIIDANADLNGGECPDPECDRTVECCDVSDGMLYVVHESDGVGLDSRSPRGKKDGCLISTDHGPTL